MPFTQDLTAQECEAAAAEVRGVLAGRFGGQVEVAIAASDMSGRGVLVWWTDGPSVAQVRGALAGRQALRLLRRTSVLSLTVQLMSRWLDGDTSWPADPAVVAFDVAAADPHLVLVAEAVLSMSGVAEELSSRGESLGSRSSRESALGLVETAVEHFGTVALAAAGMNQPAPSRA